MPPIKAKMRPGQVIRLRVNPTECLQVLDFLRRANIEVTGRSFSACASIVWHALMKDAERRGFMHEVDGFSYNEQMAQFLSPEEIAYRQLGGPSKEAIVEDPNEVQKAQEELQKLLDKEEQGIPLSALEQAEKKHWESIVFG